MNYLACWPALSKIVGAAEKVLGRSVAAITLGPDVTLILNCDASQRDRLERHEAQHRTQAARFLPWWARGKANPLSVVGNKVASGRFLAEYLKIYRQTGYLDHPWEVEARNMENPS